MLILEPIATTRSPVPKAVSIERVSSNTRCEPRLALASDRTTAYQNGRRKREAAPIGNFPTWRCVHGDVATLAASCEFAKLGLDASWIKPHFDAQQEYVRMKSSRLDRRVSYPGC
jgi:hypothetical protein